MRPDRPKPLSSSIQNKPWLHARRTPARFAGNRQGATTVEFALVATPFIFMMFCIVQIALILLVNVTLENAVGEAARQIRTGQNQTITGGSNNYSAVNAFRQTVCNDMSWLQTACLAGVAASMGGNGQPSQTAGGSLVVDVQDPSTFSTTSSSPTNSNGQMLQFDSTNPHSFCAGGAGSIVVFTAYYPWTMFTPYLSSAFTRDSNGGQVVLRSAAVFKNEPFGSASSPC